MTTFLTVPTRGDHPELLEALCRASTLPRQNIVVIRTADVPVPEGVAVLDASGPLNIHRWWNMGIDYAKHHGASNVAVLNDDLVIDAQTIIGLTSALEASGAAIATPGPQVRLYRNHFPLRPLLIGSLWVLDLKSGLRPNENFQWWYGDDDLDIRARRDFNGLVTAPVWFDHPHASQATDASPLLQQLVAQDEQMFRKSHPLAYSWRILDRKSGGRLRHKWKPSR
jgi:hypothetical protein